MFQVLIVEDNSLYRKMLKGTLTSRLPEISVSEAGDGVKALQEVENSVPDLIFMDIELPGENGLVLTKKIKKENPDAVIAILTNHDSPEYRDAAFQSGAAYFLAKESTGPEDIVSLVQSILIAKGSA